MRSSQVMLWDTPAEMQLTSHAVVRLAQPPNLLLHCTASCAMRVPQVMLWDWLKVNLPGYLTLPRLNSPDIAAPATPAAAAAQPATGGRSMGRA
jgi:hypothetical protein